MVKHRSSTLNVRRVTGCSAQYLEHDPMRYYLIEETCIKDIRHTQVVDGQQRLELPQIMPGLMDIAPAN